MQKHNSMTLSTMVQGWSVQQAQPRMIRGQSTLNLSMQIKGIVFERTLTYFGNS